MKPVAKIVFDTKYDSNMTLVSKSRPQIFKTNVDLMGFEPDTYLYTADQLREAQVKVLRECVAFLDANTNIEWCCNEMKKQADELEKQP